MEAIATWVECHPEIVQRDDKPLIRHITIGIRVVYVVVGL